MDDSFEETGATKFSDVLDEASTERIATLFGSKGVRGRRLTASDLVAIENLLTPSGPIGGIAASLLGGRGHAVRALLLDKSEVGNWSLGWHQDRTIAVAERVSVDGFGPWTVKQGQIHVQPPQSIINRMVTLRVHVDRVDGDNSPLRALPGSHLFGRLSDSAVTSVAERCPAIECHAGPGDIWAYRTAFVHASAAQRGSGRRRVLQLDYSSDELPGGLCWALRIA